MVISNSLLLNEYGDHVFDEFTLPSFEIQFQYVRSRSDCMVKH